MTWILLIPAMVAIWWMVYRSTERTLVDVYLPVLLFFPLYYEWKTKGLPPLDAQQAIMVVFAVFILVRHWSELYFSRTDIWIFLFAYCAAISQTLRHGLREGIFMFMGDVMSILLPYLVGKLFIEQYGIRPQAVRRICFLLFLVAIGSTYEFYSATNPFHNYLDQYFPGQGLDWTVQTRWGRARVAGPYAHAILAGMMFFAGALFNLWLIRANHWEKNFRWLRTTPLITKGWLITAGLFLGVYMTESRGPWVATPFGFIITSIGLARNTRKTLIQVVLGMVFLTAVVYPFVSEYTSGRTWEPSDQDRQNAVYRRQLIENYTPVLERGGLWGWGQWFPVVAGQNSIDNEYLLIGLTRGYLGLTFFLLLSVDTFFHLIRMGISSRAREDRIFAFCLIGILSGILFCVGTVFMGMQVYVLFFFLIGWSQALGRRRRTQFPFYQKSMPDAFARLTASRPQRTTVGS